MEKESKTNRSKQSCVSMQCACGGESCASLNHRELFYKMKYAFLANYTPANNHGNGVVFSIFKDTHPKFVVLTARQPWITSWQCRGMYTCSDDNLIKHSHLKNTLNLQGTLCKWTGVKTSKSIKVHQSGIIYQRMCLKGSNLTNFKGQASRGQVEHMPYAASNAYKARLQYHLQFISDKFFWLCKVIRFTCRRLFYKRSPNWSTAYQITAFREE